MLSFQSATAHLSGNSLNNIGDQDNWDRQINDRTIGFLDQSERAELGNSVRPGFPAFIAEVFRR